MKIENILITYNVLSGATVEKLAVSDKFKVIDIQTALKSKVDEFETARKEAETKFKKDSAEYNAYLVEKTQSDTDFEIPVKISKEAFGKFLESNPSLPLNAILIVKEIISLAQ